MRDITSFVTSLNEADRMALLNALGSGVHEAHLAAQCVTGPSRHAETIPQLLARLTEAIGTLQIAREIVRREVEGIDVF